MKKYKEGKLICPNCKREIRLVIEMDILKGFMKWFEEENPYPLLSHDELIENLEKYELEIETSSENTQRQTEEEWLNENAGIGEEL